MADIIGVIGVLILIVGGILFLIEAFKESIIWGIACLLITPVVLAFTVMHWGVAKKPFFIQLAGIGVMLIGAA
ncbi:hypothetical protein CXF72_11575 [Psychromonas sp. MB-3u-54]|uniref:hypothetical protein n=1 Tax=Psychromonas sp. MB-3u-54 TaxID=2058319 RepID=UPI000C347E60|nr:hypothetical protein [Psychromonas sp. MB-3u-54]PKH02440.1 hypothetical protein CXF72_11575 [Psychromonas sp. MB-3u-54]